MKSATTDFRPDLFDAYKTWAKNEAMPYLGTQMDVLDFGSTDRRAGGARRASGPPRLREYHLDPPLAGSAHRNEVWTRVFASPEWVDILRVPEGRASYLRTEAKFTDLLI